MPVASSFRGAPSMRALARAPRASSSRTTVAVPRPPSGAEAQPGSALEAIGKAWVKARRRDPYYRAAKAQGLRSRAVFKLLQIQERFGLLYPGDTVLDLGLSRG